MRKKTIFRLINAAFWLAVWIAVILWTDTFGHWVPMFVESFIPLMLGGYIHLVLGSSTPAP